MGETLRTSFANVHALQLCPKCGQELDSMTAVGHDCPPEPGDITVCIGCGTVLEYDGTKLVAGSIDSLDVAGKHTVRRVQAAIAAMREKGQGDG